MTSQPTDAELLRRLAAFAGLVVPDEDAAVLSAALDNHVSSAELLRALELDDMEPIVTFDPRWQ